MSKLYTIAGVSRKNGVLKARFANDVNREKALIKDGQTDIVLVQLSEPMTKDDAVRTIMWMPMFDSAEMRSVLSAELSGTDIKIGSELPVIVDELEEQPF